VYSFLEQYSSLKIDSMRAEQAFFDEGKTFLASIARILSDVLAVPVPGHVSPLL
jgi:hypothetical protein